MARQSALMNVMIAAAEKAARGLVRDFGEVEQLQVSKKGPGDFVSNADIAAERTIKAELSKARPDYGFLMEESGSSEGANKDVRWIVDPLDGTTNFLHGLPHWSISIALEAEGNIVAGVVHDPVKNEVFWAERGVGAFVNARRLRVSGRTNLSESLIATGVPFMGYEGDFDLYARQMKEISSASAGVRRMGSAALDLAYVAAGRCDGFWEPKLHPWDMAAGILLVQEAGGFITELEGGPDPLYGGSVLAANEILHRALAERLQAALPSPEHRREPIN